METFNVGTNEDGTPHVLYHAPGEHVVLTPNEVSGTVSLPDGSKVDVTDRVVVADSVEHAHEIVLAIATQHQGFSEEDAQAALADAKAAQAAGDQSDTPLPDPVPTPTSETVN